MPTVAELFRAGVTKMRLPAWRDSGAYLHLRAAPNQKPCDKWGSIPVNPWARLYTPGLPTLTNLVPLATCPDWEPAEEEAPCQQQQQPVN